MDQLGTSSVSQFHRFLKLPVELQIQIWTYASTIPRIVRIKCHGRHKCIRHHGTEFSDHPIEAGDSTDALPGCIVDTDPVPPVLHVCKLSRDTGLKFYQPSFKGRLVHPIYFKSTRDELMLMCNISLQQFTKPIPGLASVCNVRSLIMAEPHLFIHPLYERFSLLPALEKLVLEISMAITPQEQELWLRMHGSGHSNGVLDLLSEQSTDIVYLTSDKMLERYGHCGCVFAMSHWKKGRLHYAKWLSYKAKSVDKLKRAGQI